MDTRVRVIYWLYRHLIRGRVGREHPTEGLIIHTDRGSQYAISAFSLRVSVTDSDKV